ncbi:MAG: acyl-[acyl-carrier-protein]-phospholipid O-acyltransferase [Rickettsiales bacterium]|jgi:acyl-[acyl-carrier-protein]-phospholipid O-acyltransferase/long-chain-fatty-acid--[acyl-carrier-protein] ligase
MEIGIRQLFKLFFKVKINDLNRYKNSKKGTIFISNLTSYLDIFIYATFLPKKPIIVLTKPTESKLLLNFLFKIFNICLIEGGKSSDIIKLVKKIKNGKKCLIFPESKPNYKGSIAKIYEDSLIIAQKTDSEIISINISNTQNSIFSKKLPDLRKKIFTKINIHFSKTIKVQLNKDLDRIGKRGAAKKQLFKIMSENYYDAIQKDETLFSKLIETKNNIKNKVIITDFNQTDITYNKLIIGSIILGEKISKQTKEEKRIGLLLPNISASMVTFFALQLIGKIPAILNFSNGTDRLLSSIQNSELKYIYSSKLFIKKAKLEQFTRLAEEKNIKIIYLEDLKSEISTLNKIKAVFKSNFIKKYLQKINKTTADDVAIILFTSGSEGNPKAVALTHKNINSNIAQLKSIIDFNPSDKAFNALPIFHSFGLVIGSILPIFSGIKTYFYPSPIHYNKIPNLIYNFSATITFGTNYFLKKYSEFADNLDFSSVRYIFAGAEKITSDTKNIYFEKFGVRILEGYGATETSPVVCLNTPRSNKFNTIGQILPRITYKIEKIKNISEGGALLVKADNVMKGYLDLKNPEKVKEKEEYYNMGDIVRIDEDGHLIITGRIKRFIKIAGEMVSLNLIESYIRKISPSNNHAVISFIDDNSKENMSLFTDDKSLNLEKIIKIFKEKNIGTIFIPRNIEYEKNIPILNTGKIDYNKLENK